MPAFRLISWRFASELALSHWLLLVALQVLGMVRLHGLPDAESWPALVARLPFLQRENLAVVLALWLVVATADTLKVMRRTGGRPLMLVLIALLGLYAVLDQAAYKILFDRVSPGLIVQADTRAVDSIKQAVDGPWLLALLGWGVGYAWLWRRWRAARPDTGAVNRRDVAVLILGVSVGLATVWQPLRLTNLERHPLVALAQAGVHGESANATNSSAAMAAEEIDALRYDAPRPSPAGLAAIGTELRRRPNIVLIVLESVGSRQLFEAATGEDNAPNLAALARRGVVFDSAYVPYGGTVPSNVALQTGGAVSTWTPPWELFDFGYRGPTLARKLAESGYQTALFAAPDLRYQGLDRFLSRAGYGEFRDFSRISSSPGKPEVDALNSWGGRDDQMLPMIDRWLARNTASSGPFFLHYMSNAPHHPYDVPQVSGALAGAGGADDYRRALRYVDGVVGGVVAALRRQRLADNTLIIITGDHGEALGVLHPTRRTHFAILDDEVLRSFFIFARADGKLLGPHRVSRPVSNGDLMNTLAAISGALPEGRGQDLFAADYQERIRYFHGESKRPRFWGLRDGRWKYVAASADQPGRLFDLDADPDERIDLAPGRLAQVQVYERLCSIWYARQDAAFVAGFSSPRVLEGKTANAKFGLQESTVGYRRLEAGFLAFQPGQQFSPQTGVVHRMRWARDIGPIESRWLGPARENFSVTAETSSGVVEVDSNLRGMNPLSVGEWRIETRRLGDRELIAQTSFSVSSSEAPQAPVPRLRSLSLVAPGPLGASLPRAVVGQQETLVIETAWAPVERAEGMRYELISPTGEKVLIPFEVPAGQEFRQSTLRPPGALAIGGWTLVLAGPAGELGRTRFEVAP